MRFLCLVAAPLLALPASAVDFIHLGHGTGGAWCFEQGSERFYSMGICHVTAREISRDGMGRAYDGVREQGSLDNWAEHSAKTMAEAGFNTAGAWCDEPIYQRVGRQTRMVWLGQEVDGRKQRLLNVFSPSYEKVMDQLCAEQVAPHRDDPGLIGWFLDNGFPWYGEFGWPTDPQRSLLDLALHLPQGDPNRQEALRFLQAYYGAFARFATEWDSPAKSWEELASAEAPHARSKRAEQAKMVWAGKVAKRFFTVCAAAVRKYDPNHLLLGCRFAGNSPGPVIAACARACDALSFNRYAKDGTIDPAWWDTLYGITQKPILVTEFSWVTPDNRTGDQNHQGPDITVPTQHDRATRYTRYVAALMARPYVLGMHWFQWADEPEHGRAEDGEDGAFGLVDWQDRGYEELLSAAAAVHAAIPKPDARTGALPEPADRDGLKWSEPPLAVLPEGSLPRPVDLLGVGVEPIVGLDSAAGSKVEGQIQGKAWKANYVSGTGWGFTAAWPLPPGTLLAGARAIRVRCHGAPGTKLDVGINGFGHDGQPVPGGVADGESWITPTATLTAPDQTLTFDLTEAEVNAYYGRQHGNHRLDLDGLSSVGIHVPGGQGTGTLEVLSIEAVGQ